MMATALLAAACGNDEDAGTGGGGGSGDGEKVVNISGSSTVAPISTSVAEKFEKVDDSVVVNIDGPGTGDGFVLFCDGETDISDASRAIKEEEAATCEENGVEYVELRVGLDGLAVITSPNNDSVDCLNFADLYALTGPESQGFENWQDAQELAAELGSDTEFPDAPLDITAPGEESGTYDSWIEIVFADIAEKRVEEGKIEEADAETTRPDYQSSGDDNIIVQGIEGSDSSLGWVGLSFVLESGGAIESIPVAEEPGGECVEPSADTVTSGDYPISRPLFIYVSKEAIDDKPHVVDFVDYYLSDEGIASVTDVDYVALSDEDLEAARAAWEDKTLGTRESEG